MDREPEEPKIVAIPARLLCPWCKRQRLRAVDVDGDQKVLGSYTRRCQYVCPDRECGYSKSRNEPFFGVAGEP